VARALAQLWDAVVDHFGGIEGFLTGDAARRGDYIQRLDTAARRMRNAVSSEKGHYYFATVAGALPLRLWMTAQTRKTASASGA
jgi:hypothetical protein